MISKTAVTYIAYTVTYVDLFVHVMCNDACSEDINLIQVILVVFVFEISF